MRQNKCSNRPTDQTLKKLIKEIKKMAKTLAEVQAAMADLTAAINDQMTSVVDLIAAVDKLIAAGTGTPPEDLQPLFDAIVAAKDTLVGDNQAVADALAKANPPPPTP